MLCESICSFLQQMLLAAVLDQMYFVFDLINWILFAPTKCHYTLGADLLQPKKRGGREAFLGSKVIKY